MIFSTYQPLSSVGVTPQNLGILLTTRQSTKYLWVSHTTIPPYHVPFTEIHSCIYILEKIYKCIKTVHKSSSYNSLIYKILHIKSSFFYKKVSQSHSSAFFTPAAPDEGQPPIHNLYLKGGPTTGVSNA